MSHRHSCRNPPYIGTCMYNFFMLLLFCFSWEHGFSIHHWFLLWSHLHSRYVGLWDLDLLHSDREGIRRWQSGLDLDDWHHSVAQWCQRQLTILLSLCIHCRRIGNNIIWKCRWNKLQWHTALKWLVAPQWFILMHHCICIVNIAWVMSILFCMWVLILMSLHQWKNC